MENWALLQEMLDEFQLRKLVNGYCRAVDRGDIAGLRGMYHPDAEDDHGAFSTGKVEDFPPRSPPHDPTSGRCNTTSPRRTSQSSGLRRRRDLQHFAARRSIAGNKDIDVIVGGRYFDKYEKRDGIWKFLARKIVTDWAHVNDPSSVDLGHPITRDTSGTPDENDPSYEFFSSLLRARPEA